MVYPNHGTYLAQTPVLRPVLSVPAPSRIVYLSPQQEQSWNEKKGKILYNNKLYLHLNTVGVGNVKLSSLSQPQNLSSTNTSPETPPILPQVGLSRTFRTMFFPTTKLIWPKLKS